MTDAERVELALRRASNKLEDLGMTEFVKPLELVIEELTALNNEIAQAQAKSVHP